MNNDNQETPSSTEPRLGRPPIDRCPKCGDSFGPPSYNPPKFKYVKHNEVTTKTLVKEECLEYKCPCGFKTFGPTLNPPLRTDDDDDENANEESRT